MERYYRCEFVLNYISHALIIIVICHKIKILSFEENSYAAFSFLLATPNCDLAPAEAVAITAQPDAQLRKCDRQMLIAFSWQGLKDDYRTYCGMICFSKDG